MGFYDEEKTAREYIAMANGYDGRELIAILSQHVLHGANVLEIGMGPGTDLDILKQNYQATGSDASQFFVDRYAKMHPESNLLLLDAVTLNTDRKFDCIYSNKVLHHLNSGELKHSLKRQHELLSVSGIVMHSFWKGDREEEMHGLKFFYRTEDDLRIIFEPHYEIIRLAAFEELEPDDSIYVLARRIA